MDKHLDRDINKHLDRNMEKTDMQKYGQID